MGTRPLVSVIVPAYNAEAFIEEALGSALNQTYRALEVVVVDDGSQDRTPDIVEALAEKDPRVRLLRQANGGVAAARNLAIEHARGVYIAPLDADDLWYPRKIEEQVRRMEAGGPAMGMVYTWWLGIDDEGTIGHAVVPWDIEGYVYEQLIYFNFIGNASVPLFRRSALERAGLYDPTLRSRGGQGCEDWDLSLRVAEHYGVGLVPGYLSAYRAVRGSMSTDAAAMAESYRLVIEKVRERHPEIPPTLFRWSRSHFDFYLANRSYVGGCFGDALRWVGHGILADPAVLLGPWVPKLVTRCLLRLLVRPVTARLWPTQAEWEAFRRHASRRPARSFEEIEQSAGQRGVPWRANTPFDAIRRRRWRYLEERKRAAARGASDPGPAVPAAEYHWTMPLVAAGALEPDDLA